MSKLLDLLCPSECAETIECVDIADLTRRGIRAVLVDLDNTLAPWGEYGVSVGAVEWIKQAGDNGIGMCIVSNTRHSRRLERLASELGLPARRVMKPRRGGFRDALKLLKAEPFETAIIGDQIFTDILGGNRLGAHTILVTPLRDHEFVLTKLTRFFERIILRLLEKRDMIRYVQARSVVPEGNKPK